ncbi:MAG: hypothetical protein H6745_01025 [Deltaproteobacteria bacterium]|nr:hypothetical protein [Deltaproteobacteria bacterium]
MRTLSPARVSSTAMSASESRVRSAKVPRPPLTPAVAPVPETPPSIWTWVRSNVEVLARTATRPPPPPPPRAALVLELVREPEPPPRALRKPVPARLAVLTRMPPPEPPPPVPPKPWLGEVPPSALTRPFTVNVSLTRSARKPPPRP